MRTSLSSRRAIVRAANHECRWPLRFFYGTIFLCVAIIVVTVALCAANVLDVDKTKTISVIVCGSSGSLLTVAGIVLVIWKKTFDFLSKSMDDRG